MKIVVMIDKSAGNDRVGDMWTETLIFDETATLSQVIEEVQGRPLTNVERLGNVRIQIGQEGHTK